MNIRNLGSKESVGVKYKDGICAELCLKLWFESNCNFVILPSQDVVTVNVNIRNLGSKESVGVKYKDGICAELCLKLWFESNCNFLILPSQDGFESYCPETKFQTINSSSQFRSCHTQMFFKIAVSQKFRKQENNCVGVSF